MLLNQHKSFNKNYYEHRDGNCKVCFKETFFQTNDVQKNSLNLQDLQLTTL